MKKGIFFIFISKISWLPQFSTSLYCVGFSVFSRRSSDNFIEMPLEDYSHRRNHPILARILRRMGLAWNRGLCLPPLSLCRGWILALLSALGRSHCLCIAIRWGMTSRCCLQLGRTGSSALWLYKSHCRGIGSQKDKGFHCFLLLGTSG